MVTGSDLRLNYTSRTTMIEVVISKKWWIIISFL
jgi:hypothetical protein